MKLLPTIPQNTGNRLADIARWAIFKPEHNKPIKTIDNEIVYKRNPNLPTVNRPGSGVVHFPKALDPDRSFAYSKKIERTRKPTSIFYRVFFISAIVGTTAFVYWLNFVRDWDDRVWGATMRRNRLKRLALHRQLTPDEEAILARPEPIPVPFHGPLWLLGEIPFNMAVKQEMRRAAREEYAEDRRLEAAGLDVPIRGGKVNWAKYGLDKDQEAMFGLQPYDNSADDSLDWEKAAGDEDDWE